MSRMPVRTWLVAAALTSVLAAPLSGCQALKAPGLDREGTSAASGHCASQCDLKKAQCEARQQQREQDCQASRARLDASGRECLAEYGPYCVRPVECLGTDTSICETERDECLMDCPAAPSADGGPSASAEARDAGAGTSDAAETP